MTNLPTTSDEAKRNQTMLKIAPEITESDLYLQGIPHGRFAQMRETPGVLWHPYKDDGFWAVTRYEDVKEVTRNAEVYSSAIGHTNLWDLASDALEVRRGLIETDAPDHTRIRRLVSRAFTPRSIRLWEDTVRNMAGELLDQFVEKGHGDWVANVAAPLPIQVILTILGVPIEDADYLVELSNHLVEATGENTALAPDAYGNTTDLRLLPFDSPASHALFEYGEKIAALRRQDPKDDVITALVQAEEEDGARLSGDEFRNLFHLLIFAGNETTRTAITHGAMAFAQFPDQWHRLAADLSLIEPAAEEVLRYATPVLHMRRTASQATVLAGTEIAAGEKVVMWYASANYDDRVFTDPHDFDIGRTDNPQLAFGGGGPHFCLGAFLARLEITVLLEEMVKRSMSLEMLSEPIRSSSNFVHGVISAEMRVKA